MKHKRGIKRVLREFWRRVPETYDGRIDALIAASTIRVETPERSAESLRREFNRRGIELRALDLPCWCCLERESQHRHHIVAISNGGDNRPNNIVGLCLQCHTAIHPWMQEGTEPEEITEMDRHLRSIARMTA